MGQYDTNERQKVTLLHKPLVTFCSARAYNSVKAHANSVKHLFPENVHFLVVVTVGGGFGPAVSLHYQCEIDTCENLNCCSARSAADNIACCLCSVLIVFNRTMLIVCQKRAW